jgi:hypothetical protein
MFPRTQFDLRLQLGGQAQQQGFSSIHVDSPSFVLQYDFSSEAAHYVATHLSVCSDAASLVTAPENERTFNVSIGDAGRFRNTARAHFHAIPITLAHG